MHTLITATLHRRRHLGYFRCLVTTLLDDVTMMFYIRILLCNELMKMTTALDTGVILRLDIFRNPLTDSETGADPPLGRWGERRHEKGTEKIYDRVEKYCKI
jgi:hypothetical protein